MVPDRVLFFFSFPTDDNSGFAPMEWQNNVGGGQFSTEYELREIKQNTIFGSSKLQTSFLLFFCFVFFFSKVFNIGTDYALD